MFSCYEELYQFANQLYNHEDINDHKETRASVNQPKLGYPVRKPKPKLSEVYNNRKFRNIREVIIVENFTHQEVGD